MSKFAKHLNEDLIGRRNSNIPKKDVASAVDKAFEDALFELESISETDAVNSMYKNKILKHVSHLRKLGMDIVKDIRSQK